MPNHILILSMFDLNSICESWLVFGYVSAFLSCFWFVGINHKKRGRLKGKCTLGPFLVVFVIKCLTH
jgi:hypothetical protein